MLHHFTNSTIGHGKSIKNHFKQSVVTTHPAITCSELTVKYNQS